MLIEGGQNLRYFSRYIRPYIKQYKWLMFFTIFLGVLTFLTAGALQFTSGYLITRAAEMPWNILLLYIPIVGVRAFGIARPVVRYLERLFGHNTVLKILSEMRVKLYDVLEPQALFIRSRFQTGDLVGTLADDIEHLQDTYIRTIFPTVVALFLMFFSCSLLAIFDWRFALWIFICLTIIVIVYPLFSLYFLKKRQVEIKQKRNKLYQIFGDAVMGASDWIISGRKKEFVNQFMKISSENNLLEKKLTNWTHARTFQLQVIAGLILIFVGIWAGFEAAKGDILPAYIAAFTLVTIPILEGMIPTSDALEKIPVYEESLNRIATIENYLPQKQNDEKIEELPKNPELVLEHVTYYYEGSKLAALKNINLSISQGEKIAILGKSGAGKSTLIEMLVGALTPTIGKVTLGNQSPEKYGEQIFDLVSILNQKPYLFSTTVENNIRLGKPDATDAEIREVIQKVKLDKYIYSLPKGLQTQMQESGERFSGGERQRIALARILLKNTPIVILDEPTVGLDPITERDLLNTMFESLAGKTIILITHHLVLLEKMDKIIFLENGEIIMEGTHDELLQTNERYRTLYTMDSGIIEKELIHLGK